MATKVLIVEDEVIVADDLEWKLTNLGYEVIGIVGSGEEAILAVERHQPDVVLMDIQIQGSLNGLETAKRIHRKNGTEVIFVTAFPAVFLRDSDQDRLPGLCVTKPFSTLQLKAALDAVTAQEI